MAGLFARLSVTARIWHSVAAFAATLAVAMLGGTAAEATPRCLYVAALASTTAEESGGRFVISNNCRDAVSVQFCVRHRKSKWPCPEVIKHVFSSTIRPGGFKSIRYSISPHSHDGRYTDVLAPGETRLFTEGQTAAEGAPLLMVAACRSRGRRYPPTPSDWIPGAWLDEPTILGPLSQYRCGYGSGGRQLKRQLRFR